MKIFEVHNWDFAEYCDAQRADFRWLRSQLERIGVSPSGSMTEALEEHLIEGLQWLDRLDRSHPFWVGRNLLPTRHKLSDASRTGGPVDLDLDEGRRA